MSFCILLFVLYMLNRLLKDVPALKCNPGRMDCWMTWTHLHSFQRWLHHQCLKDTLPLSNEWLQLNESQRFATNAQQRHKNESCGSRSIFYTSIIFCFSDLSLNNSCWGRDSLHCRSISKSFSDWAHVFASGPRKSHKLVKEDWQINVTFFLPEIWRCQTCWNDRLQ